MLPGEDKEQRAPPKNSMLHDLVSISRFLECLLEDHDRMLQIFQKKLDQAHQHYPAKLKMIAVYHASAPSTRTIKAH